MVDIVFKRQLLGGVIKPAIKMVINSPIKTNQGITIYGFHTNFEILRIDNGVARIVSLRDDPEWLCCEDVLFYGLNGVYYKVDHIKSVDGNVIIADVSLFKTPIEKVS